MISKIQKIFLLFCFFSIILIYFLISPITQEQKQLNYKFQKPISIIKDIYQNRNWDDYKFFKGNFVYDYNQYVEFCEKYDLYKAYTNENTNYIVLTNLTTGWYVNVDIEEYELKGDVIFIKLIEEKNGVTTGDIDGYVFVIPCDANIEKINVDIKNMTIIDNSN